MPGEMLRADLSHTYPRLINIVIHTSAADISVRQTNLFGPRRRTQDAPQANVSAKQTFLGPGGGHKTRRRQICPPGNCRGRYSASARKIKRLPWRTKGDLACQVSAKLAYIRVSKGRITEWEADTWRRIVVDVRRSLPGWRTQGQPRTLVSAKQTFLGPGGGRRASRGHKCPPNKPY